MKQSETGDFCCHFSQLNQEIPGTSSTFINRHFVLQLGSTGTTEINKRKSREIKTTLFTSSFKVCDSSTTDSVHPCHHLPSLFLDPEVKASFERDWGQGLRKLVALTSIAFDTCFDLDGQDGVAE